MFAPLAFATGRTGRLFIEFALTLAGAVIVSGFVALTLSPMMCSLLLKHQPQHSWIYNLIEGGINALTNGYRRLLTATLRARWVIVLIWLVILGAGAMFFTMLKSELAPLEDRGVVLGLVTAPQGSTPQYTSDQLKPIEEMYSADPGKRRVPDDFRFPDGGRRHRHPAFEAVGRADPQPKTDRRRVASEVCGRYRARTRSPAARRRSGSRFARRRSNTS